MPKFPCIPKAWRSRALGLDPRLAIFYISLINEWLKIRAVFNAVWRVEVDHLYLPGHAFLLQQAVHHQQAITGNQALLQLCLCL